jgi:hypothetical protein
VQAHVNSSALFEHITYKFLERPQLRQFLDLPDRPSSSSGRRVKRQTVTFDQVLDNPFLINDLRAETEARNQRIYDHIAARLGTFGQSDGLGPAFTAVSTKSSSFSSQQLPLSASAAFASGFARPQPPSSGRQGDFATAASSFAFSSSSSSSFGGNTFNPSQLAPDQLPRVGQCFPSEELRLCDPSARYRTFSGWCNNLAFPFWGQANTVLRRLFPAAYDDGIATPRARGIIGTVLPNPRKVSREVHTDQTNPDPKYTLMVMQWGQLVDHDLTHTPMIRGHANSVLDCRACDSQREHPACFPIPVPEEDRFFPSTVCIPFTRSNAGQQRLGK